MKPTQSTQTHQIAIGLSCLMLLAACGDARNPGVTLEIKGVKPTTSTVNSALQDLLFPQLTETQNSFRPTADSTTVSIINPNGSTAGSFTITTAKAVFKKLKLYMDDGSTPVASETGSNSDSTSDVDDSNEISIKGPFVVNFLTNQVNPPLTSLNIPAGKYKKIRLDLHKLESDQVPAGEEEMDGLSIKVSGTYSGTTSGGNVTAMPMEFTQDLDEEFYLLSQKTGVDIADGNQVTKMLVIFRLSQWLDLQNSETNPNSLSFNSVVQSSGSISLSESAVETNKKLGEIFEANIKESADFGRDSDDSGDLSSEECQEDESTDDNSNS